MVSSLSNSIREPAAIREVCSWHRWNYEPSMSRPCLLDAGMSREVVSSLSDTIREPAGIREVSVWISRHL